MLFFVDGCGISKTTVPIEQPRTRLSTDVSPLRSSVEMSTQTPQRPLADEEARFDLCVWALSV